FPSAPARHPAISRVRSVLLTPSASASLGIARGRGCAPCSHAWTAFRVTPTSFASSPCVSPFARRYTPIGCHVVPPRLLNYHPEYTTSQRSCIQAIAQLVTSCPLTTTNKLCIL